MKPVSGHIKNKGKISMNKVYKNNQQLGLYDCKYEHDACGVGFIANIYGIKSHKIVEQGIEILQNLLHRGALGGDNKTGDGAGMLLQIPHKFFDRTVSEKLNFKLPSDGNYGIGMIFFPKEKN